MKFSEAIDLYIGDMRSAGRINSDRTEVSYRSILERHAEDISNRDPRTIGREDVKRTLRRWSHPNTQAGARAVLVPSTGGRWRRTSARTTRPSRPADPGAARPPSTGPPARRPAPCSRPPKARSSAAPAASLPVRAADAA